MSLHVLATGALISNPQRRTSAGGNIFATGTIRAATEDGAMLISVIAFNDLADELLRHQQGEAIAVAGRAKFTSWTAKDGAEKHGLSVVAEQIASAANARRADADRRSERKDDALRNEMRP
jgi:single-stranded DNA-binding protein